MFRLYLMPFCVSSFAALVKDRGYILVFPPSWKLNAMGLGLIGLFVLVVAVLKRVLADGCLRTATLRAG